MNEEYIHLLHKNLKDLPNKEREAIIEEILSHIEAGEDDLTLGKDKNERIKKLMTQLGKPEDMGKGFKEVYNTDKIFDFVLIVIPYLLYPFLNALYVNLMGIYSWADVRLDTLIHLPLIAIGLWRKSALITLFWTVIVLIQIFVMLIFSQGYYGYGEISFWIIIAVGLGVILLSTAWQNRKDKLTNIFCFLPLTMLAIGSSLTVIDALLNFSYIPNVLDKLLLDLYINFAGFGGGYLPFYGTLISVIFFISTKNQDLRWLAIAFYGVTIGLSRHYVNLFETSRDLMAPIFYTAYLIFPIIIVVFGWWFSQGKMQSHKINTV